MGVQDPRLIPDIVTWRGRVGSALRPSHCLLEGPRPCRNLGPRRGQGSASGFVLHPSWVSLESGWSPWVGQGLPVTQPKPGK